MIGLLKLIRFLSYSNIWVSLGAAFFTASTYVQFQTEINWLICFFVFSSCLAAYNFQRVFRGKSIYGGPKSARHKWIIRHKLLLWGLTAFGLAGSSVLFFIDMSWHVVGLIFVLALICFVYVLPIFYLKNKWYRLRDIPFIKPIIIAFVWVSACVYFPIYVSDIQANNLQLATTFLLKALFIIAIALPFDIRDLKYDIHYGTLTIPSIWGAQNTIKIIHFLVLFASVVSLFAWQQNAVSIAVLNAYLVSFFSVAWLAHRINKPQGELYFSFVIDGALLDHFVWFVLMNAWFS